MPRLYAPIRSFSLALWWGSLSCIGFIVVPLLFVHLDSPQSAGRMAAVLFHALGYVTWVCGALVLITRPLGRILWLISLALLASLLIHFVVAPHIVTRVDLKFWHALGTTLFAAQWLCLSAVLWIRPKN
jgi:hypothetical protein